MLNSNVTLIGGNDSFLYHSIKWVEHNKYIKFIELKPKVIFEDDVSSNKIRDNLIKRIANREIIYLRDGFTVQMRVLENPHLSIAVAQEKLFPALMGFPIKKDFSQSNERLSRIMKIISESGIYVRQYSKIEMIQHFIGSEKAAENSKSTDDRHQVKLEIISDLFVLIVCGFAVSAIELSFEISYNFVSRSKEYKV